MPQTRWCGIPEHNQGQGYVLEKANVRSYATSTENLAGSFVKALEEGLESSKGKRTAETAKSSACDSGSTSER